MASSSKGDSTEPRPVFRHEDVTLKGYVPRPKRASQGSSESGSPVKVPTNPPNRGSGGKKE